MSRFVWVAMFGVVVVTAGSLHAAQPSSVSAAGVTLRSADVTLPSSDRTFAGGAAADAINGNCLTCHSTGMILTQPKLRPAEWQAEVQKMRSQFKAPIREEDVPAIVAYLTEMQVGK